MAVITDIRQQKRTPGSYSVYLDNVYAFSLSDLELSGSELRIGRELTPDEVNGWQGQSSASSAYNLALRFLGHRPRSRREVVNHLTNKGYRAEIIEPVIARLTEHGLVDDAAFAASWIASRQATRPRSRYVLEQELFQKGLDRQTVTDALDELGEEAQEQMLEDIINRRRKLSQYQDNTRLMQYLSRQGFTYDQIKKALGRLDN